MVVPYKNGINSGCSSVVTIILIAICVFIFGEPMKSSSSDEAKGKIARIPFLTIDKGYRSGIKERRFGIVISTEEEWERLWTLHKSTVSPAPKVPAVDFQQEMIVAVFSGEKRTGGYGIEIRKIEEDREKGQLRVFFLETEPPPRSMVIQAFTQPFHLVTLQTFDLTVDFLPEERRVK